MYDAYAGLGLYNYLADTLSGLAKVLRFVMGIPGGDKREGVRQLRIAMEQGVLTRAGARFYLANVLRIYEHDFSRLDRRAIATSSSVSSKSSLPARAR